MPRRWTLLLLALLVLSILLGKVYRQRVLDLIDAPEGTAQITPPPCDLNSKPCPLPLFTPINSEAPWHFAITPHPIPVSAPLTLTLTPPAQTLPGNQPKTVWVDLTGDSMDMGLIHTPLTAMPDGHWEGTTSIPVCVTGRMRWRARLHIQLEQALLQADWTFDAPTASTTHPSQPR